MSATEPKTQDPQKKITAEDLLNAIDTNTTILRAELHGTIEQLVKNNIPEMPYSWNTYMIAPDGSKEQFTVRKTDAAEYVKSIAGIKKHLAELGYKPIAAKEESITNGAGNGDAAPICGIHNTPMEKRQGKNGSFWSCHKKLDNGEWCPYKPKG